jgi:hypothetical protein
MYAMGYPISLIPCPYLACGEVSAFTMHLQMSMIAPALEFFERFKENFTRGRHGGSLLDVSPFVRAELGFEPGHTSVISLLTDIGVLQHIRPWVLVIEI